MSGYVINDICCNFKNKVVQFRVHLTSHLLCIWIRGMKEPCTVKCKFKNFNRLGPPSETTITGLDQGNSTMMSIIEEHFQVKEGIDGYTKVFKELATSVIRTSIKQVVKRRK